MLNSFKTGKRHKFRRHLQKNQRNLNSSNSAADTSKSSYSEKAARNETPKGTNNKCKNCCEDFSTYFPFSFNIFLPGTKEIVRDFVVSRHRLTTSGLRCRLRMGLNTFDSGCTYGKERVLRVEGMTREEVIKCVDLLDSVFPDWKVWRRGKTDSDLI
ncbi:unnamed protein product [Calicophoron daubneyi]|uniref:LAGLIDADG homing endonuclease n=1 Tax=Calicophoron daubneyi TaxID=300641 RepID=A0AAV2T5A9_CALDB